MIVSFRSSARSQTKQVEPLDGQTCTTAKLCRNSSVGYILSAEIDIFWRQWSILLNLKRVFPHDMFFERLHASYSLSNVSSHTIKMSPFPTLYHIILKMFSMEPNWVSLTHFSVFSCLDKVSSGGRYSLCTTRVSPFPTTCHIVLKQCLPGTKLSLLCSLLCLNNVSSDTMLLLTFN